MPVPTPAAIAHLGAFEHHAGPGWWRWTARDLLPRTAFDYAVAFAVVVHQAPRHEPDARMVEVFEAYRPTHAAMEPQYLALIVQHYRDSIAGGREMGIADAAFPPDLPEPEILSKVTDATITVGRTVYGATNYYGVMAFFRLPWDEEHNLQLEVSDGTATAIG